MWQDGNWLKITELLISYRMAEVLSRKAANRRKIMSLILNDDAGVPCRYNGGPLGNLRGPSLPVFRGSAGKVLH